MPKLLRPRRIRLGLKGICSSLQQLEIENGGWKRPSYGTGPRDILHDPARHPEPTLRTIEPVPYPARHPERLLLCFRTEPLSMPIWVPSNADRQVRQRYGSGRLV